MSRFQRTAQRLALGLLVALAGGLDAEGRAAVKSGFSATGEVQLPAHDKRALEKLNREAGAGNAKAAFDLATLYLWGGGVKQDFKTSEKWFRKSAEGGFRPAQLYLAAGYGSGEGLVGALPSDRVEGLRWSLVAMGKQKDPRLEVEVMLLKQNMTPDQIAEAERRARGVQR